MTTHFEKEIFEQVDILSKISPISIGLKNVESIKRVVFIASGSSKNAADFGMYFFEQIAKIPAKSEYASEVLGRETPFFDDDLVVFVSQSGKSSDVLEVLTQIKDKNCKTLALVNNVDSPIAKSVDYVVSMEAGDELAVPASKSFSASYLKLYMLANYFAKESVSIKDFALSVKELLESDLADTVVEKIKNDKNIVILGHNLFRFAANEIGLKIKETSFITTMPYPLGEFIHGHMAVLKNIKTVVAMSFTDDKNHQVNLKNIQKIKDTYNPEIVFLTDDESQDGINLSYKDKNLLPLLAIILFQQVSLKLTVLKGIDPDSPEGLHKIVQ